MIIYRAILPVGHVRAALPAPPSDKSHNPLYKPKNTANKLNTGTLIFLVLLQQRSAILHMQVYLGLWNGIDLILSFDKLCII